MGFLLSLKKIYKWYSDLPLHKKYLAFLLHSIYFFALISLLKGKFLLFILLVISAVLFRNFGKGAFIAVVLGWYDRMTSEKVSKKMNEKSTN